MISILKLLHLSIRTLVPSWLTRALVGGVGVLAIVWGFAEYNQTIGKKEILADSKKAGQENAKQSETHHVNASRPGAADRVRKKFCRDC